MTTINRKIRRGTIGHKHNPLVIEYHKKYDIGNGLIFKIITEFGDSEYSHKFCAFIQERMNVEKLTQYSFSDLLEMFNRSLNGSKHSET